MTFAFSFNLLEELCLFQLYFSSKLFIDAIVIDLEKLLLFSIYLLENFSLLAHLLLKVLKTLESVISVVAKQGTMRTDALLVRNADDIHHHLMSWTQLLCWSLSGSSHYWQVCQKLIVLRGRWLLAGGCGVWAGEREEEDSIEWKDTYVLFLDMAGAETADDHILFGIDDIPQACLADAVRTAG